MLSVYVITLDNQEGNSLTEDDEKRNQQSGNSIGLESKTLVWRVTTRKFDSSKPEWIYAQVAVSPDSVFRVCWKKTMQIFVIPLFPLFPFCRFSLKVKLVMAVLLLMTSPTMREHVKVSD